MARCRTRGMRRETLDRLSVEGDADQRPQQRDGLARPQVQQAWEQNGGAEREDLSLAERGYSAVSSFTYRSARSNLILDCLGLYRRAARR